MGDVPASIEIHLHLAGAVRAVGEQGRLRIPAAAFGASRPSQAGTTVVVGDGQELIYQLPIVLPDCKCKGLFHRFQRALEFLPFAREAEADVAFAVGAEVHARHAPDPAALDQKLRDGP